MNRSKAKGTRAETELVTFLRQWWLEAERRALSGSQDRGDIAGVPGVVFECKSAQRIELAAWVDEMETERKNAGAPVGVLVIKRRGKGMAQAYAVMPLERMVDLLRDDD